MSKQRGNVLFLILIAVALFAALSYAVTQSARGNQGGQREVNTPEASQLIQYVGMIDQAHMRLSLINGCGNAGVSFESSIDNPADRYHHTPNVDDECKIFHADGGGLTIIDPIDAGYLEDKASYHWPYNKFYFLLQKYDGVGVSSDENLVIALAHLRPELCVAVNEIVGISNPGGLPPSTTSPLGGGNYQGLGSNDGGSVKNTSGSEISGHSVGCYRSDTDVHYFYYVIQQDIEN